MLAPHDRREHVVLLHAVLERDDAGIRPDHREDLTPRALGVSQFHREDDHVDLADGRGVVGRLHLRKLHRLDALYRDAVLPQGFQLGAARDEGDIRAAILQHRAVIAADAARAHDRDLHSLPPAHRLGFRARMLRDSRKDGAIMSQPPRRPCAARPKNCITGAARLD